MKKKRAFQFLFSCCTPSCVSLLSLSLSSSNCCYILPFFFASPRSIHCSRKMKACYFMPKHFVFKNSSIRSCLGDRKRERQSWGERETYISTKKRGPHTKVQKKKSTMASKRYHLSPLSPNSHSAFQITPSIMQSEISHLGRFKSCLLS